MTDVVEAADPSKKPSFAYRLTQPRALRAQFLGMDVLRGVASLMILLYHAHDIALKHSIAAGDPIFRTPNFWYSVIELFFTMSGFLMVHMSYEMYGKPGAWRKFLMRRAIRTPPLYYIYTIGVFAIFALVPSIADYPATIDRLVRSLLFTPGPVPPVIAIGWTLNYEVYFYVLIGLGLFLRFPWGPIATAITLCLVTAIGQMTHPTTEPFHLWTDRLVLDFAIGIAVALLYYGRVVLTPTSRWIAIAIAVLLLSLPINVDDGTLARPLAFGTAMGLIVAVMTLRDDQPRFGRFEGVLTSFGTRAYTLYLCHILVIKLVEKVYFRYFSGTLAIYAYIVVATACAILASFILYRLIEYPVTRALQRWAKRHGTTSIR